MPILMKIGYLLPMNEVTKKIHPDIQQLPSLTLRQMEVFFAVCREGSYANAALELRSTRPNIKRVCEDFQKAVGRPLFEERPDRTLQPTTFANELLTQTGTLSRSLRHLTESVRSLHEKGRILRFAAAGELFKGGLFTDFLARLRISDAFRPCFLRIEANRYRIALLNAECDVYFGAGIVASNRLELVDLGGIPWTFKQGGSVLTKIPSKPADMASGKWWIAETGDPPASESILQALHLAGASGGRILKENSADQPANDEIVLHHDITSPPQPGRRDGWPSFRFSAVLKKQHPYSELMARLTGVALA